MFLGYTKSSVNIIAGTALKLVSRMISRLAVIFILFGLIAGVEEDWVVPAMADAGPALEETNVVGSTLNPYHFKKTQVRMVDEQVNLIVEAIRKGGLLHSRIKVDVDFHMFNTSPTEERMQAVFPLSELKCPWVAGPGSWTIREHQIDESSFQVRVDGRVVETQPITTTTTILSKETGIKFECTTQWRSFEVAFPSGRDVRIRVSYTMSPGNELAYPWDSFTYVLKTGEPWYGTIGKVDFSLKLPYEIGTDDLLKLPVGYQVNENTVRWRWREVEPHENFKVVALSPQTHKTLSELRKKVLDSPEDAESWIGLAEVYQQMAWRYDYPSFCGSTIEYATFPQVQNWRFANLAVEAYRRAARLDEHSIEVKRGLAIILASISLSANNGSVWANYPSARMALQAFDLALNLEPDENQTSAAKEGFLVCLGDGEKQPGCACGY